MPGSESTVRSSSSLDIRKTPLAVAPSRSVLPLAPCGCSAALSCAQFSRIGRGSTVALSPPGRIAKRRWPSAACGGVRTRPSTVPFETIAPTRSASRRRLECERLDLCEAAEASASGLPGCANRRTLPLCTGAASLALSTPRGARGGRRFAGVRLDLQRDRRMRAGRRRLRRLRFAGVDHRGKRRSR